MKGLTALERAFELARTGQFLKIQAIRDKLRSEGLNHFQVSGPGLTKQLMDIGRAARAEASEKSLPGPPEL